MMPASNQGVGMNTGFPDVCTTPTPGGPVPIPYPNVGMNATSMPFCPNVMVSMVPGHNMGAKPLLTNGDNAGVAHPMFMQTGGCTMGNPMVTMSGLPSEHLAVPTYGNNMNDPVGAKTVPSVVNVLISDLGGVGAASARDLLADLAGAPPAGLGATLLPARAGAARVLHVRAGGAAEALGLRRGDLLHEAALDHATAAAVVRRPGRSRLLSLEARRPAPGASVDAALLADGVGLLVVRRCALAAPRLARAALADLAAAGADRLVLDLRGNPGGALAVTASLAGLFLPEGAPVAHVAGRTYRARGGDGRRAPLPVVVVDRGTASAAEALAAALQDHGAPVVGEATFGKGTARTARCSARGAHVTGPPLTVARPAGAPLAGGVRPDVAAAAQPLDAAWRLARRVP